MPINNQVAFGYSPGAVAVPSEYSVRGDIVWGYQAVDHPDWNPTLLNGTNVLWQMGPDATIDTTDFYVIAKDVQYGYSAPLRYYQNQLVGGLVPVGCVTPTGGTAGSFTRNTTGVQFGKWSQSALNDAGGYPGVIDSGFDWTVSYGPALKTAFDVGSPNTPMYLKVRRVGEPYVPNTNYPVTLGPGDERSYDDFQGEIVYQITNVNVGGTILTLTHVSNTMNLGTGLVDSNPFWQRPLTTNISGVTVATLGTGDMLNFTIVSQNGNAWDVGGKGGQIGGTVHFWRWGTNGVPVGVALQNQVRNFAVIMGVALPGDSFVTCGSKLQTAGYWCNWLEL
jgi:hypothetical protein